VAGIVGHFCSPTFAVVKILAFLALLIALPHEFFISILTIKHETDRHQLHLTWRMTTHDVEHALEPLAGGRKLHLGTAQQHPQADSLLRSYVLSHLQLRIDGLPVNVEYLGREVEMDDMYCYLLVEDVKSISSIEVQCTLLHDMFDEQENAVHVEANGLKLTHSFRNHAKPHTFKLQP
jgi:hypothetical protein